MNDSIKMINDIKIDDELFNNLVDETIKLMKAEVIQTVTNREYLTEVDQSSKQTLDEKLKARSRKNDVKSSKLENINLESDSHLIVGEVIANRFLGKSDPFKDKARQHIQKFEKMDSETLEQVKVNEYETSDLPLGMSQEDLRKRFPKLVQEQYFNQFIGSSISLNNEFHESTQPVALPKLKLIPEQTAGFLGLDPNTGEKIFEKTLAEKEAEQSAGDSQVTSDEKAIKRVDLFLHRVKCVEKTSSWLTDGKFDEINMGGVTLDHKQVSQAIREFRVGDFDGGTERLYNPPKVLRTFIGQGSDYPKIFSAYISLAEKDSEGFSEFLDELYEAIKKELNKIIFALGTAAGGAIGSSVGGTIGLLGGPIGIVIGIAAGAVLGGLIGWLVTMFENDIFTPQMTLLAVELNSPSPGTVDQSPISTLSYQEHDAI